MIKPEEMTNEELLAHYEDGLSSYKIYSRCDDGSDGACWEYSVLPYLKELKKRGLLNDK